MSIYSGVVNLSTGNTHLVFPLCGWGGKGGGVQFSLVFNSQSTRSSALGPKWTHSYRWQIFTGSGTATVVADDGTEMVYTLSNGVYVPPVGFYDTLTQYSGGTWKLGRKGGTNYFFNSSGQLTGIADISGNYTTLNYTNGVLTSVIDPAGRTLTLGYNQGVLNTITDCQNRTWSIAWDAHYDVHVIYDPSLGTGSSVYRLISYDANYNINAILDRLGKTWYINYSGNVFLNTLDPDSHTVSLAYPALNTGIAWPATAVSNATWTNANGKVTTTGFDVLGRPVGTNDATSRLTTYTWDNSNNRTGMTLPSSAAWQWGYDTRGNQTSSTDPFNQTTISQYDYNNGDVLKYTKDPNGFETFYNYPTAAPFNGNLLSVQDARGYTTNYQYNTDGSVKQVTDAEGRVTKYGYDSWGHRNQITVVKDANTSYVTNFVFDKGSHVTQRTDARGRVTNYTYDAWGRLKQKDYPTSSRPSVQLFLDVESRLTKTIDATGTRLFNSYDAWGRCLSMNDPMAGSNNPLLATYDAEGNLKTQQDVTGRTISYGYDDADRLLTVSDDGNATQASYLYDSDGNMKMLTLPNGVVTKWAYTTGRLTGVSHAVGTNAPFAYYTTDATSFDAAGRLLHFADFTGDTTALTYDPEDNLLTESRSGTYPYNGTYSYVDKTNLRTSAQTDKGGIPTHNGAYSYDGAGRLTQVIDSVNSLTEGYTWYADGTLSAYPLPGSNGATIVLPDYDEEGNLVQLKHQTSSGTVTAYEYGYAYDGGRRWKKDYTGSTATWYPCGVACSAGELAELSNTIDSSGNTTGSWTTSALYLPGGAGCGSGTPIRRHNVSANTDEYHHTDLLGVAGVLTNAGAAVISSSLYDCFGVQRYSGAWGQTFQFAVASPYRFCRTDDDGLLKDCDCDETLPIRDLRLGNCGQNGTPSQPVNTVADCDKAYTFWWDICMCKCKIGKSIKDDIISKRMDDCIKKAKSKAKKDECWSQAVSDWQWIQKQNKKCRDRCGADPGARNGRR